jgi:hypothetical protein
MHVDCLSTAFPGHYVQGEALLGLGQARDALACINTGIDHAETQAASGGLPIKRLKVAEGSRAGGHSTHGAEDLLVCLATPVQGPNMEGRRAWSIASVSATLGLWNDL